MLTDQDKLFLLSVKNNNVDWSHFAYPGATNLPAIKWKLHNLKQMEKIAHATAVKKLEEFLQNM